MAIRSYVPTGLLVGGNDTDDNRSDVYKTRRGKDGVGIAQVQIVSGTGTVNLEGRTHDAMPWEIVHAFTADEAVSVMLLPHMRFDVQVTTTMAVNAGLVDE